MKSIFMTDTMTMHHATSRDGRENGMYDCLVGVSCTLKEGRLEKRSPFGKIDCERSASTYTLYVTMCISDASRRRNFVGISPLSLFETGKIVVPTFVYLNYWLFY